MIIMHQSVEEMGDVGERDPAAYTERESTLLDMQKTPTEGASLYTKTNRRRIVLHRTNVSDAMLYFHRLQPCWVD